MSTLNWRKNALTERLNVDLPLFQAPMGNLATAELASAVAEAGGVGGLGMMGADPAKLRERILAFRQRSSGALNINFVLFQPTPDAEAKSAPMRAALSGAYSDLGLELPDSTPGFAGEVEPYHLEVIAEARPNVVSFHLGLPPDPVLNALRDTDAFIISSATTVNEACELEHRGVNAIIAQGLEAGGHRGTFSDADAATQSGLFSLLPQVVDAVSVPVIAAGGIADGRGIAAALMLGASAVQMGTAFLLCPESGVSDNYRRELELAGEGGTVISDRTSGKPARILQNAFAHRLAEIDAPTPPFPVQFGFMQPLAAADADWLAVYAGQSASMSRAVPARTLMSKLVEETDAAMSRLSTL